MPPHPFPPTTHPSLLVLPSPPIFPVAFLLFYPASLQFFPSPCLNFFCHLFHPGHTLISDFTLCPLHHLLPISLSCFVSVPHPPFLSFLPFFSPTGNSRQLVCLAADCTHARPNVETDTPPQGALDFVLPCCGTDLLTKVWGCLRVSCQSVHSAERVNFW